MLRLLKNASQSRSPTAQKMGTRMSLESEWSSVSVLFNYEPKSLLLRILKNESRVSPKALQVAGHLIHCIARKLTYITGYSNSNRKSEARYLDEVVCVLLVTAGVLLDFIFDGFHKIWLRPTNLCHSL